MQEYRSCHSIEGELFFNHMNKVGYCSMLTPNGGQPVLYENYTGELIDWDDFFKKRFEHIELMKSGGCLPACNNCLWIRNAKWNEQKKEFNYILLNVWVKCNFRCIYCLNHSDPDVINNTKEYNLIPVIKDMIDKKVLTPETKIDIAGGESTLDPHFNELLKLFIDKGVKNININTNASVYSESIQKGIEKGCVSVITSVDSADSKKFKLIKNRDLYKQVWSNLRKYSYSLDTNNSNTVRAKYIIISGINDTKKEIRNFILKSKKNKMSAVILSTDLNWLRKNYNDFKTMHKIIKLTEYFIKTAQIAGINWYIWAYIEDLITRYNILYPEKKVDINFIFKKDFYASQQKLTIKKIFCLVYFKILKFFL